MKENHAPLALCGLFTALMAVGAFIHIMVPLGIWQVTISLQIFVAVLAGLFLGRRLGFLSVLAYLVLGLAGLPVFAHGGGTGVSDEAHFWLSAGVSLCGLDDRSAGGQSVPVRAETAAGGSLWRRNGLLCLRAGLL